MDENHLSDRLFTNFLILFFKIYEYFLYEIFLIFLKKV